MPKKESKVRNSQLQSSDQNPFAWGFECKIRLSDPKIDEVLRIFSVTISGWYFGKTGGLLGVYDNEPSNDWMTSGRAIVSDVAQFAETWRADSCPSASNT